LNWVKEAIKDHDGMPCPLLPTIPSPKTEGYRQDSKLISRSKYEFTFGRDLEGEKTCGFLLGLYKEGVHAVLNPSELLHVSVEGKKIANMLQDYVKEQEYDVYDRIKQEGVYRTALVRTLGSGECMIMLQINPTLLSEKQIEEEKIKFKDYIINHSAGPDKKLSINSLYIQLSSDSFNGFKDETPSELLHGTKFVTEKILGLSFQISPTSFFQVNPTGTEILYAKIRELTLKAAEDAKKHVLIGGDYVFVTKEDLNPYVSQPEEVQVAANTNPGVVLLDLCCGTGTIGISMAKHVKKVIGVEMVAEAIEDAKKNAVANGILLSNLQASKM
jgi:tRNA (uracil-5-)-methyltransferase